MPVLMRNESQGMVATKAMVTMKAVLTASSRVKRGYEKRVSRAASGMVYLMCL